MSDWTEGWKKEDVVKKIKSSIKKWKPGIWKRMEANIEDAHMIDCQANRRMMFYRHMWNPCGFCDVSGRCGNCPLNPEHCDAGLIECEDLDNTMGKIISAWTDKEINVFHRYRRKLVKAMAKELADYLDDCDCDMCDGIGVVS